MASIDDDDDHLAASISTMSLDDAASCIVKGVRSVRKGDMPFVNRHEELWQLFRVNADNCHRIATSTEELSDFRELDLLFCVQYFGAGKTTLGQVFPNKVKDEDVMNTFASKFGDDDGLKLEWKIIQERGMRRLLIDVRAVSDIVREAARLASNNPHLQVEDSKHAAGYLIDYAVENGPTLFHFDEVGADVEHDLGKLRKLAVATWAKMWQIKNDKGLAEMPRIYFLVTGKSTEPFQEVDIGSNESPCGSYFLVLDMLSAKHVGDVRTHVMSTLITHPLVLFDLDEEKHGVYLDECLAFATGGAPRLLLYALRALHHLRLSLKSKEAIERVVNDDVFTLLSKVTAVSCEFHPSRDHPSELTFFRMLLAFRIYQHRLQHDTSVKIGAANTTIGRMLRFQPFFLSRGGSTSNDQFVLHLPLYHLKASVDKLGAAAVPLLLIAMAGAAVTANEPWRIFEMLPAHIVATQAALRHSTNQQDVTWAQALPDLLGGCETAKQVRFDLGGQPYAIHLEKAALPAAIDDKAERYVKMDGAVLPVDKSNSADLFHVQRDVDGRGHVVIEWQQKFKVATALQMSTVRDEVLKCNQTLPTIFILFAATVGPSLLSPVKSRDDNVLVLTAWSKDDGKVVAAEYILGSGQERKLLWRQAATQKKWYVFPSTELVFCGHVKQDAAVVSVRPGLEVVIPHHDVVRGLVGKSRFDTLIKAATVDASVESTSAMITTLDEVFGGRQQPQKKAEVKLEKAKVELKDAEKKLKDAEKKLKEAQVELKEAKVELKEAEASGDDKAIGRADRAYTLAEDGVTSAQKGVTSAQDMVTHLTNAITVE
jgi:hypothetical protein